MYILVSGKEFCCHCSPFSWDFHPPHNHRFPEWFGLIQSSSQSHPAPAMARDPSQPRDCSGTADPAQLPSPDTSLQLKLLISLVAGLCCRRKNGFSLGLCCRRKKGAGLSLKGGRRDRDFCGHWLNEELKLTPGALSLQKQQTHPVSEP